MGRDRYFSDLLNSTFDSWKADLKIFGLPSLEHGLANIAAAFISFAIILPLALIIYFPFMFSDLMEDHFFVYILLRVAIQLLGTVIGLVTRSLIEGGTVEVVHRIKRGEEYKFLDIVKRGFKRWGRSLKLMVVVYLFQTAIMLVLIMIPMALLVPVILLSMNTTAGIFLMLIIMIFLIFYLLLLIPVSIFLSPMPILAFTIDLRKRTGAIESTKRSWRWMMKNKLNCFKLGGILFIAGLAASFVPIAGIVLVSFATLFIYDVLLQLLHDEEKKIVSSSAL